jgi:DNA-directed RNA polymerase sigma subunit (sigma70/sigma32)
VQLVSSDPELANFLKSPQAPCPKPAANEQAPEAIASVKVGKAIQTLGKLEAEVIEALFPTSGDEPETFEDLADRLGMTVEEVKGVADNALRGLRGSRLGGLRISTVWN